MKFNNLILKSSILTLCCSSIIIGSNIQIVDNFNNYPITKQITSISRGGDLPDKRAIQDGLGTVLLGKLNVSKKLYTNKSYNKLLIDNEKNIINNDKSLSDLVTDNTIKDDNNLVNKSNSNEFISPLDGKSCPEGTRKYSSSGNVCLNIDPNTINPTNTCQTGYSGNYTSNINCHNKSLTDSDLDKFFNLTSIDGYLYLYYNQLTNIDGLSNLTTINGILNLSYNQLTNIDGLSNLTSVNGYLSLNNNQLTNIDGLSNLTSISGYLNLYNNSNLVDLSGLKNITTLNGNIAIDNHTITTKIPSGSWLCNTDNKSKFPSGYLQQVDACESVSN